MSNKAKLSHGAALPSLSGLPASPVPEGSMRLPLYGVFSELDARERAWEALCDLRVTLAEGGSAIAPPGENDPGAFARGVYKRFLYGVLEVLEATGSDISELSVPLDFIDHLDAIDSHGTPAVFRTLDGKQKGVPLLSHELHCRAAAAALVDYYKSKNSESIPEAAGRVARKLNSIKTPPGFFGETKISAENIQKWRSEAVGQRGTMEPSDVNDGVKHYQKAKTVAFAAEKSRPGIGEHILLRRATRGEWMKDEVFPGISQLPQRR